ncbi:MAG: NAD(P)H-hydrate dehydratase [Phenylobacterium sp.]
MSGVSALDAALLRAHPLPSLDAVGDKDARGSVLVVAGSVDVPGAALLSAEGALRAGAGRLRMAAPDSIGRQLGVAMPEARVYGLPETETGDISPSAREELVEIAARADALLIGPGMVSEPDAADLAGALLKAEGPWTLVLDAAALTGLAGQVELVRRRAGRTILTPHAGEMATLLDRPREAVEADPCACAREAAAKLQAVVAMKGAATHVASPDGVVWRYPGGGPGLGTSGSGDVLAGVIAGIAARGAAPAVAAMWGVWLHGEAGARLAKRLGPVGFLARELAAEVPGLLAELG